MGIHLYYTDNIEKVKLIVKIEIPCWLDRIISLAIQGLRVTWRRKEKPFQKKRERRDHPKRKRSIFYLNLNYTPLLMEKLFPFLI